jgi:Ca2+/H+ antiporter
VASTPNVVSEERDRSIDEYARYARRRTTRILAIASLVCIALGIALIVIVLAARQGMTRRELAEVGGRPIGALLAGAVGIVVGVGLAWAAFENRRPPDAP